MVLYLQYLQYLCLKTQNQISDKIQQISDIFQQNIWDIFQQTDISVIKSGNRHFGHIQAYFFGLIQHAQKHDVQWLWLIALIRFAVYLPRFLGTSMFIYEMNPISAPTHMSPYLYSLSPILYGWNVKPQIRKGFGRRKFSCLVFPLFVSSVYLHVLFFLHLYFTII